MVPTDFPSSFKEFLASKVGKEVTIHFFEKDSITREIYYVGEDYLVTHHEEFRFKETNIIPFSQILYISDYD